MAGYMTKLQGYVYEGEWTNGAAAAVANGVLMVPGTSTNNGKLVLPSSADTTTKLLLKEVTDIFDGTTAYRFVVEKLNANYYFVENGYEIVVVPEGSSTAVFRVKGQDFKAHLKSATPNTPF